MQVLVVSPVALLRRSLQLMLEYEKHRVVSVDSMEDAVSAMSANCRIDVAITEWKLDGGTALELQRRIQQIDRLADDQNAVLQPHFIVLATPRQGASQGESRGMVQEIQGFGFRDVFEKPLDRSRILEQLRRIEEERNTGERRTATADFSQTRTNVPRSPRASNSGGDDVRLLELKNEVASLSNSIRLHEAHITEIRETISRMARSHS